MNAYKVNGDKLGSHSQYYQKNLYMVVLNPELHYPKYVLFDTNFKFLEKTIIDSKSITYSLNSELLEKITDPSLMAKLLLLI